MYMEINTQQNWTDHASVLQEEEDCSCNERDRQRDKQEREREVSSLSGIGVCAQTQINVDFLWFQGSVLFIINLRFKRIPVTETINLLYCCSIHSFSYWQLAWLINLSLQSWPPPPTHTHLQPLFSFTQNTNQSIDTYPKTLTLLYHNNTTFIGNTHNITI